MAILPNFKGQVGGTAFLRTPSDIVDRYRTGEAVPDSPPGGAGAGHGEDRPDCGRGGASRGAAYSRAVRRR